MSAPELALDPATAFRWQDGERLVVFGRGTIAEAGPLLGSGYALLSTPRAVAATPELSAAAGSVHEIGPGRVEELAAALRDLLHADDLILTMGAGNINTVSHALPLQLARLAPVPNTRRRSS